MDYRNINLKDSYERGQAILDSYSIDNLLLEIQCNFRKEAITPENVKRHIKGVLDQRYSEALEIFEENLNNICKRAIAEKEK